LLVGTVPLVFNLASYVAGKPVPTVLRLDQIQRDDLLLTSAQSAFAVAMLLGLHLSILEAALLAVLFFVQLIIPETHLAVTMIYLVLSAFFVFRNRSQIIEAVRNLGRRPAAS
jgi:cation:H+ antiporter